MEGDPERRPGRTEPDRFPGRFDCSRRLRVPECLAALGTFSLAFSPGRAGRRRHLPPKQPFMLPATKGQSQRFPFREPCCGRGGWKTLPFILQNSVEGIAALDASGRLSFLSRDGEMLHDAVYAVPRPVGLFSLEDGLLASRRGRESKDLFQGGGNSQGAAASLPD